MRAVYNIELTFNNADVEYIMHIYDPESIKNFIKNISHTVFEDIKDIPNDNIRELAVHSECSGSKFGVFIYIKKDDYEPTVEYNLNMFNERAEIRREVVNILKEDNKDIKGYFDRIVGRSEDTLTFIYENIDVDSSRYKKCEFEKLYVYYYLRG